MLSKSVLARLKLSSLWLLFLLLYTFVDNSIGSRNSPEGIIYNQCANIMLRYAIKTHEGHNPDAPKQLFDSKVHVPPPPKPGDVKVIIAGFPW